MGENPQEPLQAEKSSISPIWAVSAKIVEESPSGPGGRETRRGTRKFNANQKVYLWHTIHIGENRSNVIGRYRGKYNYINVTLETRYLTRFRAEMLYSPTIIEYILYGYANPEIHTLTPERIATSWIPLDGSEASHQRAITIAQLMNKEADELRAKRLKHFEAQRSTE